MLLCLCVTAAMTVEFTINCTESKIVTNLPCYPLKDRLTQVQLQMGRQPLKLIQEVETRWNSCFQMFQRLYELRELVGAALASLQTDIPPLTAEEYRNVGECLRVLSPFNDATVELSEEKRVSGSKVIPLLKMLEQSLQEEMPSMATDMAAQLGEHLV